MSLPREGTCQSWCPTGTALAPHRVAGRHTLLSPAAYLLTVFSVGTGLSGAASRSAWLICSASHTGEWRLAHCRGVSPSLFFKVTSESRERKRLQRKDACQQRFRMQPEAHGCSAVTQNPSTGHLCYRDRPPLAPTLTVHHSTILWAADITGRKGILAQRLHSAHPRDEEGGEDHSSHTCKPTVPDG